MPAVSAVLAVHDTAMSLSPADAVDEEMVSLVHVVCSSVSALCCVIVLGLAMSFPALRRFPANMLLWKTLCDLVTSCIVVGINASLLSRPSANIVENGEHLCSGGVLAGVVRHPRTTLRVPSARVAPCGLPPSLGACTCAYVQTGFCLLASPGWFFALAYNLNRSLHDPFTKPQSRLKKFHLGVWLSSLVVGIAVGSLHAYRANLHMCWSSDAAPAFVNWLLLFGWVLCYWLLAAIFMVCPLTHTHAIAQAARPSTSRSHAPAHPARTLEHTPPARLPPPRHAFPSRARATPVCVSSGRCLFLDDSFPSGH